MAEPARELHVMLRVLGMMHMLGQVRQLQVPRERAWI